MTEQEKFYQLIDLLKHFESKKTIDALLEEHPELINSEVFFKCYTKERFDLFFKSDWKKKDGLGVMLDLLHEKRLLLDDWDKLAEKMIEDKDKKHFWETFEDVFEWNDDSFDYLPFFIERYPGPIYVPNSYDFYSKVLNRMDLVPILDKVISDTTAAMAFTHPKFFSIAQKLSYVPPKIQGFWPQSFKDKIRKKRQKI